jgi:hypothetical protein
MYTPGISMKGIAEHFSPALQPYQVRELVEVTVTRLQDSYTKENKNELTKAGFGSCRLTNEIISVDYLLS